MNLNIDIDDDVQFFTRSVFSNGLKNNACSLWAQTWMFTTSGSAPDTGYDGWPDQSTGLSLRKT